MNGLRISNWYAEQIIEERTPNGVRILINAPPADRFDSKLPTRLILYALPNGNTIEQTLGCKLAPGMDWHFDIQHIAAQTRRLREIDRNENIVLVCLEAEGLSWPARRQKHSDNSIQIKTIVEGLLKRIPGSSVRVSLIAHSGGGSFLFGFLNSADAIPDYVERIAFLDANYSYSDTDKHGDKLIAWMDGNSDRRLIVVAYDDRNIKIDGKMVIGPDGGTYRASHRMLDAMGKKIALKHIEQGDFDRYEGHENQCLFEIHRNPLNKILHTALVGEMNGYLMAASYGTPLASKWGAFGGPRAYGKWIQPADKPSEKPKEKPAQLRAIPPRKADATGGIAAMMQIAASPTAERETFLEKQVLDGNIPEFLRSFKPIRVNSIDTRGAKHTVTYQVMPDYLSIGSDSDFVRIPLTPMTALRIADAFVCALTTRKMCDDIYMQAEVKLEPHPMTVAREAVITFLEFNAIIETQRSGKPLGMLVAGIKKDVVNSVRLLEKPNHVAIYGWHKLDGFPIQPLTIVHKDTYVDYSHGIRLVSKNLVVDGKRTTIDEVLKNPMLRTVLSDE